jgi:hypothetical protein
MALCMRMVYLRLRREAAGDPPLSLRRIALILMRADCDLLRITRLTGVMLLRNVLRVFMALTGLFLVVEAAGDMLLAMVAALAATEAALFALTECALAIVAALRAMVFAASAARAFASPAFLALDNRTIFEIH